MFRPLLAFAALLLALCVAGFTRADDGGAREVDAQRLVHILGYVAADYGAAVDGGRIVNQDEYDEQLSLLSDAAKIAERLAPDAGAPDLAAEIAAVRRVIEAKEPEDRLKASIEPVRERVIAAFKLVQAPSKTPSAVRARNLWLEHCSTCHGEDGKADTPRARSLQPPPTNFHDPDIGAGLSPFRIVNTVRFGVNGTAMVPFSFLSNDDRWDLAFYVAGLRHADVSPASPTESPTYALGELSVRTDGQLLAELEAAGITGDRAAHVLSDLRRRAPYEDRAQNRPLGLARARLDRARIAVRQGDLEAARGLVIDAYLQGVEPAEGTLLAVAPDSVRELEREFMQLRAALEARAPAPELNDRISALLAALTRAESSIASASGARAFGPTMIKSATILLREGVEAALLVAALLGIAAQAGIGERRRWVHAGWMVALGLGGLTFLASRWVVEISGARRELVEGVTALLATAVLFYVSYSLIAKKELARWMSFLKSQVSPRRAALSLFGISFIAAYREAFETVLFYQSLLADGASTVAVIAGIGAGAALLLLLVIAYTRAGRFTPPRTFFRVSSWLLYALAFVFVGQGIASLQKAGAAPVHLLSVPAIPALGIHPTIETCAAQLLLVALAAVAFFVGRDGKAPAQQARSAATG